MSGLLFATYTIATGRITKVGSCIADDLEVQPLAAGDELLVVEVMPNPLLQYVMAGKLVARVPLAATWNTMTIVGPIEEAVLSGLPIPCTVYVDNESVLVEDGSFEFTAATPGDYVVRVDEVGFLTQEWIIDAN
jgi:hypothetical protein